MHLQKNFISQAARMIERRLDELTPEQQEQVAQGVFFDKLKTELSAEILKSKVNLNKLIDDWVDQRPVTTKAQYLKSLERFIHWTELHQIHLLDLQRKDVKKYLERMHVAGLSLRTQRYHLSILSSFYSYLMTEGILQENPVKHVEKPTGIQPLYFLNIPTSKDIKKIQKTLIHDQKETRGKGIYLRQQSAKIYYAVLHMCCEYGIRVGGLTRIHFTQVNDKTYWKTLSKGHEHSGPVQEKTTTLFKALGLPPAYPFSDLLERKGQEPLYDTHERARKRIITAFSRIVSRTPDLYRPFSVHSFRHHFACKLYLNTHDPKLVQQALGHSSLLVTDAQYLSGIDYASPYFTKTDWFKLSWNIPK